MAHDVFVSHSAKDKTVADAMVATLEANAVRCWVAPRDVLPGADWGESIIDAIEASSIMVLIFSRNANESPQIKREVERAVNKGVYTIPFRIDNIQPTKSLEYFISAAHWLDAFSPPLAGHLDNLAKTVRAILQTRFGLPARPNVVPQLDKAIAPPPDAMAPPEKRGTRDSPVSPSSSAGLQIRPETQVTSAATSSPSPTKIERANLSPVKLLTRYADSVYCIVRVIIGLMYACHGGMKVLGFPPPLRPGFSLEGIDAIGAWIELGGGLLIAAGLLTRLAAFLASGEMAVAYFMVHAEVGFFPTVNHGESAVSYCWFFLFVLFYGAGNWSVDAVIRKRWEPGPPATK